MKCTASCQKALPGRCDCSCHGAGHGTHAAVRQLRLVGSVDESDARKQRTEPANASASSDPRPWPDSPTLLAWPVGSEVATDGSIGERSEIGSSWPATDPTDPNGERPDVVATSLLAGEAVRRAGATTGVIANPVVEGAAATTASTTVVLMRVPHDVELAGRRIHLCPGTRHQGNAALPIWIASHNGRRASGMTPQEAAREVLG